MRIATYGSNKPRLAVVSSHNICCALAYYADALKDILSPAFEVEIIDLKTSHLLRQEGSGYQKLSQEHIDTLCRKLEAFDLVNVHLELGIYGSSMDLIVSRILQICRSSGRLILTVHTINYKDNPYQHIIQALKDRPSSNPFHLIAHLPQENTLLRQHFAVDNVSDFPLIYLTDERRKYFQSIRNPTHWKQQFGFKETDKTIGVFGLLSPHKNYLHALRTLNLLPSHYKLLIIGEAHHMNIQERKIDPVIQEMTAYLDNHPSLAERVFFTGKRPDAKYYEDLTNVDFVLLSSVEVGQSGSATFSNALELCCAALKSNTCNAKEYNVYFPDCFEIFDIGNHYETKDKILNFDTQKIENLRKRADRYSETQLRQLYLKIYESMKAFIPIILPNEKPKIQLSHKLTSRSWPVRSVFNVMPPKVRSLIRKIKHFNTNDAQMN
jgi:glycosyltransferase involved in cell wall biosynthesis